MPIPVPAWVEELRQRYEKVLRDPYAFRPDAITGALDNACLISALHEAVEALESARNELALEADRPNRLACQQEVATIDNVFTRYQDGRIGTDA